MSFSRREMLCNTSIIIFNYLIPFYKSVKALEVNMDKNAKYNEMNNLELLNSVIYWVVLSLVITAEYLYCLLHRLYYLYSFNSAKFKQVVVQFPPEIRLISYLSLIAYSVKGASLSQLIFNSVLKPIFLKYEASIDVIVSNIYQQISKVISSNLTIIFWQIIMSQQTTFLSQFSLFGRVDSPKSEAMPIVLSKRILTDFTTIVKEGILVNVINLSSCKDNSIGGMDDSSLHNSVEKVKDGNIEPASCVDDKTIDTSSNEFMTLVLNKTNPNCFCLMHGFPGEKATLSFPDELVMQIPLFLVKSIDIIEEDMENESVNIIQLTFLLPIKVSGRNYRLPLDMQSESAKHSCEGMYSKVIKDRNHVDKLSMLMRSSDDCEALVSGIQVYSTSVRTHMHKKITKMFNILLNRTIKCSWSALNRCEDLVS